MDWSFIPFSLQSVVVFEYFLVDKGNVVHQIWRNWSFVFRLDVSFQYFGEMFLVFNQFSLFKSIAILALETFGFLKIYDTQRSYWVDSLLQFQIPFHSSCFDWKKLMNRTDSILWTSISFDNQSSSNRRPAFENVNTINHVTNMPNLKMYDSSIKRRVFKNSWANYNHNKKRFIQRSHFCVCFDPNLVWICILCFCPSTGWKKMNRKKKWTENSAE